ncbi:MAG: hypothetical protein EXR21_00195 [Flavobacteriaceae bacterium]|nr:hypothetical protein [Flavobacteriaceae bacterium]
MYKIKWIFLWLMIPLGGWAQVMLVGKTLRSSDSSIVEQVVVVRQNDLVGSLSGIDGFFSREVRATDILFFKRVGFFADTLRVAKIYNLAKDGKLYFTIYLNEKPVELPSFNLTRKKTVVIDNAEKRQEWSFVLDRPVAGASSPLTAIWQQFSKKGKELRKLEDLFYADEQKRIFAQRFNRLQAYLLTGLVDKQLDDYLVKCRPVPEFVSVATDYELIMYMKGCFEDWKKVNFLTH